MDHKNMEKMLDKQAERRHNITMKAARNVQNRNKFVPTDDTSNEEPKTADS